MFKGHAHQIRSSPGREEALHNQRTRVFVREGGDWKVRHLFCCEGLSCFVASLNNVCSVRAVAASLYIRLVG